MDENLYKGHGQGRTQTFPGNTPHEKDSFKGPWWEGWKAHNMRWKLGISFEYGYPNAVNLFQEP